jgi:hypothetical protein
MDACMELLQFEDQQSSTAKLSRFSMDVSVPQLLCQQSLSLTLFFSGGLAF